MPFEKRSLNYARKRGVRLDEAACDLLEGLSEQAQNIEQARLRIRSGHSLLTPSAESAYRAFLAYYIANSDGLEPSRVVDCAKEFAFSTGLSELPSIESKIALRLGIDGLVEENL